MAHQIGAARAPIRVLGIADPQINVPGTAAAQTLTTFTRHPNSLAGLNSGGNSHLVRFGFLLAGAGIGAAHGNGSHGPLPHFLEGDEDVASDILTAARGGRWLGGAVLEPKKSLKPVPSN